jgi:hypothetical protein
MTLMVGQASRLPKNDRQDACPTDNSELIPLEAEWYQLAAEAEPPGMHSQLEPGNDNTRLRTRTTMAGTEARRHDIAVGAGVPAGPLGARSNWLFQSTREVLVFSPQATLDSVVSPH